MPGLALRLEPKRFHTSKLLRITIQVIQFLFRDLNRVNGGCVRCVESSFLQVRRKWHRLACQRQAVGDKYARLPLRLHSLFGSVIPPVHCIHIQLLFFPMMRRIKPMNSIVQSVQRDSPCLLSGFFVSHGLETQPVY